MKILLIILSVLIVFSCKDGIQQSKKEVQNTEAFCPEPNPELEPTQIEFSGISEISDVQTTSLKVSWEHKEGIHQYHVIRIEKIGRQRKRTIVATVSAPDSEKVITGLVPNTEYSFMIRAIDNEGFIDSNTRKLSATTLDWPNFANLKSLYFNGAQSLNLSASNIFDNSGRISFSLWFKTATQPTTDSRLITFHRGDLNAGAALSVAVQDDLIKFLYADSSKTLRTVAVKANYADNNWHNIIVTYNNTAFGFYLDGQLIQMATDTFSGFGSFPLSIASYSGIQKGFVGNIDEVAIFNAPLGTPDVTAIYNGGSADDLTTLPSQSSLVTWLRNGDNVNDSETQVEDNQGTNHAGTLNITSSSYQASAP
ncbi:MAG: hypothetical protein CME62_11770 [Halobacteriovoraceae bacterium]|nr:hypothetical protein [Halobacteriovoraceae bacterium]|tara:strand:+ start:411 stop:1511 length:1101 start_codon:yes stop_codon:yes gene_type:complete